MEPDDLTRRLDAAFERFDAAFERNAQALDRSIEAFDRNIEALDRNEAGLARVNEELRLSRLARERSDEQSERLFTAFTRLTRDIAERFDRAEERFDAALAEFRASLASFERKLDDSIDESKSHHRALMAVLERLGPSPETP